MTSHRAEFEAALAACQAETGHPAHPCWRPFLFLLTALPGLWRVSRPAINFRQYSFRVGADEAAGLSTAESLLLRAAVNLFERRGTVDLAALASYLDDPRWQVFLEAIRAFRSEAAPRFNPTRKESSP